MKPKMFPALCTSKENIPPVVYLINGIIRPQNVNVLEIIFILAILEFILTTVKQIKRKMMIEVRIFKVKNLATCSKSEIYFLNLHNDSLTNRSLSFVPGK